MLFSQFMQEWLYEDRGYYSQERTIGKEGDFYTSVSSSRYFGGTIGYYLYKLILKNRLPRNTVVCEIGAHKGYLLADLIQFIYTFDPDLIKSLRFVIVEPFEPNRVMQKSYFQDSFADEVVLHHVASLEEIQEDFGFVVANELLDAFPCELFQDGKIATIVDEELQWIKAPENATKLATELDLEKGELPVGYEDFFQNLTRSFKKLEFITFDYGEWKAQNRFTLRTYRKHETKPFEEIDFSKDYKISDITYDVPFEYTKDLALKHGLDGEYSTQVKALIDMGILEILEILEKNVTHADYLKEVATVKTLIDPTILGERFKCLRLRRISS